MLSHLTRIFTVIALVFATNAACFCWVQVTADSGCHASAKMKACCCTQDDQVANESPAHQIPVLPPTFQRLDVDEVVSVVDDLAVLTSPKYLLLIGHKTNSLLRSPPDLYVLHATFLI